MVAERTYAERDARRVGVMHVVGRLVEDHRRIHDATMRQLIVPMAADEDVASRCPAIAGRGPDPFWMTGDPGPGPPPVALLDPGPVPRRPHVILGGRRARRAGL